MGRFLDLFFFFFKSPSSIDCFHHRLEKRVPHRSEKIIRNFSLSTDSIVATILNIPPQREECEIQGFIKR